MTNCGGCEVRLAGRSNIELLPAFAEAPIACTLEGGQLAGRAEEFRALFAWLIEAERTPKGFCWTFQGGPGVERRVRELARREHLCCPFLSFAVSTQGEQVLWETRGPEHAAEVLDDFFALAQLRHQPERALVQLTRRAAN
jgi:hypothetical protein